MRSADAREILNVGPRASPEEVRSAYKKAALRHHPDKNPGDPDASDRFRQAFQAYQVLSGGSAGPSEPEFFPPGWQPNTSSHAPTLEEALAGFLDLFGALAGMANNAIARLDREKSQTLLRQAEDALLELQEAEEQFLSVGDRLLLRQVKADAQEQEASATRSFEAGEAKLKEMRAVFEKDWQARQQRKAALKARVFDWWWKSVLAFPGTLVLLAAMYVSSCEQKRLLHVLPGIVVIIAVYVIEDVVYQVIVDADTRELDDIGRAERENAQELSKLKDESNDAFERLYNYHQEQLVYTGHEIVDASARIEMLDAQRDQLKFLRTRALQLRKEVIIAGLHERDSRRASANNDWAYAGMRFVGGLAEAFFAGVAQSGT